MKKQFSLTRFLLSLIREQEAEQRFSTAHIYRATLNAFTTFAGGGEVYFGALNPASLKQFENFLRIRQLKWNTSSTYMRTLRAAYNRAADKGLVPYVPKLFKGVYTGVKRERKLALSAATMHKLIYAMPRETLSPEVEESRELLRLMFQLQGMPFVDLAHLHHSDFNVRQRVVSCHRRKTGTPLEINLSGTTLKLIELRKQKNEAVSPYLLDILDGGLDSRESYEEYQRKLRKLNGNLKVLAKIQGVDARVSSYTARHTWATLAKSCGISEGLICDALGHTSVKTTETYLKSFDNKSLEKANNKVIGLVKAAVTV